MKKAPIPGNEVQRLKDLISYDILDTESEVNFDDFTKLASQICNTPISLISLVDSERQWFKSKVGIDVPETPRDVSFCGHAIHGTQVFEVPNATLDERFVDNPLVTGDLKLRFYAGAPIVTPSGSAIGTLCVIDHEEKDLTPAQKNALEALSRQIVAQLELRKALKKKREDYLKLKELGSYVLEKNEQLVETAKWAMIGEMSSGIAHEINNPLTIITGKCGLLLDSLEHGEAPGPEDLKKDLQKIFTTSERIAQIVNTMKSLSRGDSDDLRSSVVLLKMVKGTISLCEDKFKKFAIPVGVDIDEALTILSHGPKLTQVLLNLLQNSLHAIEALPTKWVRIEGLDNDETISLSVTDSGPGIPPELREKIMNPFFTTKDPGKGTGLGLAISNQIINSLGGTLKLDTNSKNTKFVINLPKR